MIDDVGSEDLYVILLSVFLSIVEDLYVKDQQTAKPILLHFYSFFLLSGISDSIDFIAFITSSLDTGPTVTYETGTFSFAKYSRRASREPRVDAATPTPKF
jgi:hypothetical protein